VFALSAPFAGTHLKGQAGLKKKMRVIQIVLAVTILVLLLVRAWLRVEHYNSQNKSTQSARKVEPVEDEDDNQLESQPATQPGPGSPPTDTTTYPTPVNPWVLAQQSRKTLFLVRLDKIEQAAEDFVGPAVRAVGRRRKDVEVAVSLCLRTRSRGTYWRLLLVGPF